ncbi:MAG: HEAT repeat domain-containing protein [Planctomycetota bacterium]
MLKTRTLGLLAASLALAASAMAADDTEQKLIAVLESDAPAKDKAIPCKKLAIHGTKAAVPALAKLLPDKELASWARIALEAIPAPAADGALRDALGKLEGRLLIGTINSIGVRRDPKAVDPLVAKLKAAEPDVACAAAAALGRIGGDKAVAALVESLSGRPPAVRSTAAHACVRCAERRVAEGKAGEGLTLYEAVRKADVPQQRHREAIRGIILARGDEGVPLLIEQMRSKDKQLFGLGLRVARELPGSKATTALVAELPRLTPHRRSMLLYALADRGDPKALPAVLTVAKSGPKAVRLVAMDALARFGDASCLDVLLAAAAEDDADVAKAAVGTLADLPGEDVDGAIAARLAKASGKTRQVLIELIQRRRIKAALPALVDSLGVADAGVRQAALGALGALGGIDQLPALVTLLQKTEDRKEREAIEKALTRVSARGGADSVAHLMPLAKSDAPAVRSIAFHALAAAGGPKALAAVKAGLDDKDPEAQTEAVRTLSTWPNKWPEDAGVVEPLLSLAKSSEKLQHQVLALRGYLQYLQSTSKLSPDQRLAKVKDVLPLVKRPEEKRLAISVLGLTPRPEVLDMLVAYAAEPKVAEEACSALVAIAGHQALKAVPKDERRKALQTALKKARSGRTKRRAKHLLNRLK